MSHLSDLQISMLADGALSDQQLDDHLHTCAACQQKVASAQAEMRFINSAVQLEAQTTEQVSIPKFSRPTSLRGFAMANIATGLAIWLAQFLWKTLFGELIVNATTWLTSVYLPDVYAMSSATALYLLEEGTAMFDAYLGFIIATLLTAALAWCAFRYRKVHASSPALIALLLVGTFALPQESHALDVRRSEELVTVTAEETIDDTLIAAGDTVRIEGRILGDVIAVGRSIDINGEVQGNLIAFAESVTVRGAIGGIVIGASANYDLRGAKVAGDVWVAGEKIEIDSDSQIARNATIASQSSSVEGTIGKDLYAFGETVELTGKLGQNMEVFANRLRLLGDAEIGGDLRIRSDNANVLSQEDSVTIIGETEYLEMPEALEQKSRYLRLDFYLWEIAKFVGSFIIGLGFLYFVPSMRRMALGSAGSTLKSAGIGFLAVISLPIMATLVAVTIIGLPLSLITFAAWGLGLYLAKIMIAAIVGRMILSESESLVTPLLAGLLVVFVAINLPFIGGIISFFLTIIGLGLIIEYMFSLIQSRNDSSPVAA